MTWTFFTESGKHPFSQRLIVATAPLSKHAEEAFEDQQIPVHTLTLTDLDQSRVDWGQFTWETPEHLAFRPVKTLRPHQVAAIEDVCEGLAQTERGQLIMACGTGKTLTGLRLAEQLLPSTGGTVLVLTPSIALVSQTLREWTAEAERPLRALAVCSDRPVGDAAEDFRPSDLAFPATTDPDRLAEQWAQSVRPGTITVIFSTYQSIETVGCAQQLAGQGHFDLVIADEAHIVPALYRLFTREWYYFDDDLNNRVGVMSKIFPHPSLSNVAIAVTSVGARKDFSCLIANTIPDLEVVEKSQCFPLCYYEAAPSVAQPEFAETARPATDRWVRHDAITDWAWQECRQRYGLEVTKEDIFYYVYGLLHAREYREQFAADLKKMLPRIPWVDQRADFLAFSQGGRDFAHWHLAYETVAAWPVNELVKSGAPEDPNHRYHVEKLRFGKNADGTTDKTVLLVNSHITLTGIPLEAYGYMVNGRSALEWVMDRYQIKQDKASGIVNDPNQWSEDPRYIVDLIKRVVRVSMETVRIVDGLPALRLASGPNDEATS